MSKFSNAHRKRSRKNIWKHTFCARASTQTLVILDMPSFAGISSRFSPLFVLRQSVERLRAVPLCAFDDRCNELLEEAGHVKKRRPEVMDEIDDEALDMAAVMVLISHDHQMTISQGLYILLRVSAVELESHYLHLR